MEALPPTTDALFLHAKRASYQASVWAASHRMQQQRPTPSSWGGNWMSVLEPGTQYG